MFKKILLVSILACMLGVMGAFHVFAAPPAGAPVWGAGCSGNLFPVVISSTTFLDENNDGIVDIHYEENEPTYLYRIYENKLTTLNNFGYVHWSGQASDAATLAADMGNTAQSDTVYVGDN